MIFRSTISALLSGVVALGVSVGASHSYVSDLVVTSPLCPIDRDADKEGRQCLQSDMVKEGTIK